MLLNAFNESEVHNKEDEESQDENEGKDDDGSQQVITHTPGFPALAIIHTYTCFSTDK